MSFDLPLLPDGWTYKSIEKCARTQSISYGVVQPGVSLSQGVPIVRVNNFNNGRIELNDLMKIDPKIEAKYSRTRLAGGEVLITLVGSVGQVAVASEKLAGFNVARAVAVIHPAEDISPNWLAICLRSPLSQYLLVSRANTTVQTTVNLKDLRALPVPIPPKEERDKIELLILALDDLIALLRETNTTLESIAQALFKSWFVDFDPVHANAGTQAPSLPSEIQNLFPSTFVESPLGLVPEGWGVGRVENVMELAYGKALKASDRVHGDVPVYGSGGVTGCHNESLVNGPSIIVGRKGTVGTLYWEDRDFFPIDTVFYVKPKFSLCFCYYLLKSLPLADMNTDAAVPGLNRNNVYRLEVVMPPEKILMDFDQTVSLLRASIFSNDQKIQHLSELRDTLLPRLISGQLRLPEVEEMLQ